MDGESASLNRDGLYGGRNLTGRLRVAAALAAFLLFAFSLGAADATNELSVAREALRDGLWSVARAHVQALESDEAREIILESYAREEAWPQLLDYIKSLPQTDAASALGELSAYYRALALSHTARGADALAILDQTSFHDVRVAATAAQLSAQLHLSANEPKKALEIVRTKGFAEADGDARMTAAEVLVASGDQAGAAKIWREVASDTNASDRAFATAAENLNDVELLRMGVERVKSSEIRRELGVRLARLLLTRPETFDEGVKRLQAAVKDSPDTPGIRAAFISLADAYLAAERFVEASDTYHLVLETWPEAGQDFRVQDGRGWAFRKLKRYEEAIAAFARASEIARQDEDRATALVEEGDTLNEMGRADEAMSLYRQVLEKFPSTAAGARVRVPVRAHELETQGRGLYKDYRFAEAQKVFAELAEVDPARRPQIDFYEVLCLYGQGKDHEAAERARVMAESSPNPKIRSEATLWLAKFLYNRRRWTESCRLFSTYATREPKSSEAPSAWAWSARAAFAANDFPLAVQTVTKLVETYPTSPEALRACLVQGEALIELARFDEAVLILERVILDARLSSEDRLSAELLRADAFFAMGADNPIRYDEALAAYRKILADETLSPGMRLSIAFKTGLALEKSKHLEEAIDQYYTEVVLAYRAGRLRGERFDDEARAAFARAAFRLADEYESRGQEAQAMHILELVVSSDVPASDEAEKRIDRIQTKGRFL